MALGMALGMSPVVWGHIQSPGCFYLMLSWVGQHLNLNLLFLNEQLALWRPKIRDSKALS